MFENEVLLQTKLYTVFNVLVLTEGSQGDGYDASGWGGPGFAYHVSCLPSSREEYVSMIAATRNSRSRRFSGPGYSSAVRSNSTEGKP
jgi:hypothetical protein